MDRERTLADLRREFPYLRYEAQLYAAGPLLHQAADDPALAAVVRELEGMPEFRDAIEELRQSEEEARGEVSHPELQGRVVSVSPLDLHVWNKHVIGSCLVEGLSIAYPPIKESGGTVQVRVAEDTRIERRVGGARAPSSFAALRAGDRIEIGFFSFTEHSTPVTIYPESLTVLEPGA